MIARRAFLQGAAAISISSRALAAPVRTAMPVAFVSHGSPRLPIDKVRSDDLRRWGAALPLPTGIVVMTPHFATRGLEFGPTHRGFGVYDMPGFIKKQLPQDLDYASPPSDALATRIEKLIGPVTRSQARGFTHTTWMPLLYLYPPANVPVLEIAYPYRSEPELLALGKKLAPLRDEGVLFVASGQLTHNLASMDLESPVRIAPAWSREFDEWVAFRLVENDIDALVDWRHKAPASDLAHPDDGAHFRVLHVALGLALGNGASRLLPSFPVTGFESTMSRRCVELV